MKTVERLLLPAAVVLLSVAFLLHVHGGHDASSFDGCTRTVERTYTNNAAPEGPTNGVETEITTWTCP
ncbi:MAG: hypothetical protein AB7E70_20240 [Hyphomicrobiaceae bacterium]